LDNSFDFPETKLPLEEISILNLEDFTKIKLLLKDEKRFIERLFYSGLNISEVNSLSRFELLWNYREILNRNNYNTDIRREEDYERYESDSEYTYGRQYFNSSNKNLDLLYKEYKDIFSQIITSGVYINSKLNIAVENLISSYEHIISLKDYEQILKEISKREWLNRKDAIKEIYNEKVITNFQDESSNTWFYNFWVRRNLEGNDKVIYEILVKIKKSYE